MPEKNPVEVRVNSSVLGMRIQPDADIVIRGKAKDIARALEPDGWFHVALRCRIVTE